MKHLKFLFAASIILISFSYNSQTTNIEDVEFNNSMEINGVTTVLNGGGLREKYGFINLFFKF